MQTFGKTLRNSLPAIGLGLLGAFGIASVGGCNGSGRARAKGHGEKGVRRELQRGQRRSARPSATRKRSTRLTPPPPHAEGTHQKSALEQIRVSAPTAPERNHQDCIDGDREAAQSTVGGLAAAVTQELRHDARRRVRRHRPAGQGARADEGERRQVRRRRQAARLHRPQGTRRRRTTAKP